MDWIGNHKLLSVGNLFPSAFFDYGFRKMLDQYPLRDKSQAKDPINDPINDPIKKAEPSEREQQIIDLLRYHKGLTRSKMAEMLGCSEATVKRTIQTMTQKGLLRRIGSNKTGEWIITE